MVNRIYNRRARICCDFRALNKRTKKDAKSLPLIDEAFDMSKGATVYSTVDLISGYWHTDFTAGTLGF